MDETTQITAFIQMTSSKERRRERRRLSRLRAAAPGAPQPQNSVPRRPKLLRRIAEHPILALIGLIASVLTVGYAIRDAFFRSPEISASQDIDPSEPFAFPFAVKNTSDWFSMDDAKLHCGITKIVFARAIVERSQVVDALAADIPASEHANFRCVIVGTQQRNAFMIPGDHTLLEGHLNLWMTYHTFWIPRTSRYTQFTWYVEGKPPRWIEGQIVN